MPLSPAAARKPIHKRQVTCHGYQREDGLWDIEGHIVDTKTYEFQNKARGPIQPGDPVHEMWVRLTVDNKLTVLDAEAVTDKSPYPGVCPQIAPDYAKLKGLRIAPGWTAKVKALFAGTHGCTHLTELLGPVATTAFQTIFPMLAREIKVGPIEGPPDKPPPLLNTCHALSASGPVVREWAPEWYRDKDEPARP